MDAVGRVTQGAVTEGIKIDNSLFYIFPHPVLLPDGEGIAPIKVLRNYMS